MNKNSLVKLHDFGQSIWPDFIRRGMLKSGKLQEMIDSDSLRGVTSNPAIFEKAIDGSTDYDEAIRTLALDEATAVLDGLAELGIDLNEMTDQLEAEGVQKFIKPLDKLMDTLEKKRQAALTEPQLS